MSIYSAMSNGQIRTVNIGLVERPVPPVRDHFDEQEMARLVSSIRENGVLVPLMVREKGDKFEVIDGDRRLQACWSAGVREIPVMVHVLNDSETHVQRMLANLDRHDPDPVSEARYIAKLINDKVFTIEQFSEKLGRSMEWIEARLTIAEMPDYMQKVLSAKELPLGVCFELNQINDANTKERYFNEALRNGMTVHSAKVNRLMANEAIDALRSQGETVTEENVPVAQIIPKVRCALTDEVLPVTATRMIRVGIENYEQYRADVFNPRTTTGTV